MKYYNTFWQELLSFLGLLGALVLVIGVIVFLARDASKEREKQEKERGPSPTEKLLGGTHELRKLNVTDKYTATMHGSYFLIGGSISAKGEQKTMCMFSFKLNDGDYALAELPVNKIRVRFDSTVTVPYVKFKWGGVWATSTYQLDELMRSYIQYMVLVCREEDYPKDINIDKL